MPRTADFQVCCIADFQIGRSLASLNVPDIRTAPGLETCSTKETA